MSGWSGGSGRIRPGELLSPSSEEGIECLGHGACGARTTVSDGVVGMIAGPALCVRHSRSPRGKSEDFTIPFPSFSPQGLSVSDSTHNAGSQNRSSGCRTYPGDRTGPVCQLLTTEGNNVTSEGQIPTARQRTLWETVQQAKLEGLSFRATARELGIHRNTVRKYALAESPPLRKIKSAATTLQPETVTPA